MTAYRVYCDESCHLENDGMPVMVLGAVFCSEDRRAAVGQSIRRIKAKHGLPDAFEIKWTKVSPAGAAFYTELIAYFMREDGLRFRALVVSDKTKLDHGRFEQTHDGFYYKAYWQLLHPMVDVEHVYRVFLDIKDTRGTAKVRKLHEVLCNGKYDFARSVVSSVQQVRSDEVEHLQLVDLLVGAVTYANRKLTTSRAKLDLISMLEEGCHVDLRRGTSLGARKFNVFLWHAQA